VAYAGAETSSADKTNPPRKSCRLSDLIAALNKVKSNPLFIAANSLKLNQLSHHSATK
jgi:hypothetical protein